jgi:hypothetical protein
MDEAGSEIRNKTPGSATINTRKKPQYGTQWRRKS